MSPITIDEIEGNEGRFGADAGSLEEAAFTWRSAHRTDLGRVRHINEDALLDLPMQRLWAVADGMGGHSRGDYASKAVVQQLQTFTRSDSLHASLRDVEARLLAANEQCRTAFRDKRPGTTVAAMLAHGHYGFFLWAGDSRVYRLRGQALQKLTEDHSLAQQKFERGELTVDELDSHHSAHVLTRAVGAHKTLQVELRCAEVQPGDRYVLCTDGLYNMLDVAEMTALLLEHDSPDMACDSLIEQTLARGARDNVSVVMVDAEVAA